MSPLARLIRAEIAASGPMRLDRYMALCLGHPEHGYYMARAPFGRGGDFTTAPGISQMFGELLGLWAAQVWLDMGAPPRLVLAELGPGTGALTADALRAAQARAVPAARHAEAVDALPDGPLIVLANEFFDALPIRQFVRQGGAWRERCVGLSGEAFAWGLVPAAVAGLPEPAPEGAVVERCAAAEAIARTLGARLAASGGAALAIDYGAVPPATGGGDTLQAVQAHAYADPLASPGEADLTAHVDFGALAAAFAAGGARLWPLATQGALLGALGIDARAAALARARPDRAAEIAAQHRRLTDPGAMGTLFRAFAATGPGQPPPPGFGEAA